MYHLVECLNIHVPNNSLFSKIDIFIRISLYFYNFFWITQIFRTNRVVAGILTRTKLWHFPWMLSNCLDLLLNFSGTLYMNYCMIQYMKKIRAYLNSFRTFVESVIIRACQYSSHYPTFNLCKTVKENSRKMPILTNEVDFGTSMVLESRANSQAHDMFVFTNSTIELNW